MGKSLVGINVNDLETSFTENKRQIVFEQMPSNLVDGYNIVSEESFAIFLKSTKKKKKIKTKNCAIVMPEGSTYFRTVVSPSLNDEQIRLNLPFEFRNYIGPDSAKYNYDYIIEGVEYDEDKNPKSLNLIAAAGLKEVVDQYANALKRAGMNLKLALPKEVCLINLMKKVAAKDKEYCLIGLGYNNISVYMFKGSTLVNTKVIDYGTKQIDEKIAFELNTDVYLAASYREKNHDNCLALESVQQLYESISLEVMKTINFYKYENSETELETAYFFDMSANNDVLTSKICEQINFVKGDINDLLPDDYKKKENAARCLVNIGLLM